MTYHLPTLLQTSHLRGVNACECVRMRALLLLSFEEASNCPVVQVVQSHTDYATSYWIGWNLAMIHPEPFIICGYRFGINAGYRATHGQLRAALDGVAGRLLVDALVDQFQHLQ